MVRTALELMQLEDFLRKQQLHADSKPTDGEREINEKLKELIQAVDKEIHRRS
jgi:hypothetical protein